MKQALVLLGLALGTSLAVACGSDAVHNVDYGQPPDAAIFNPGSSSSGDGYGSSGGNPGSKDAGPPTCSDDLKRCAEEFTYPAGTEATVELRGDYRSDAWTKGDPMTKSGSLWKVTVPVPYGKPVQYKLFVDGTTWKIDATKPTVTDANNNTNNLVQPITCTAFTCDEPGLPPAGVFDWRDSVIYFVFVDRFFDGDATNNCNVPGTDAAGNYKGGDWAGVVQKINGGYFTDLGVNTLWITVPFKNADTFAGHGTGGDAHMYSAYHGYWPFDPSLPDTCFGKKTGTDWSELKALVDAAHAKNLKVLFDYAMVHVVNTSPVYTAHNDWFYPNSNNGGDCICGQNCSWDADANRCWFTDYLPHWNYTNQAARDFSVNQAVQLAVATGVDGFRLDAIKHVDDAFKGHPTGWLTELRSSIASQVTAKQTPPQRFYMVGETYDFGNKDYIKSFVDPSTKLDGQFDFPERLDLVKTTLMRQEQMKDFAAFMDGNEGYYGASAVMSTFAGNHDLPRSIHLAEDTPMWSDPYTDGKDRAWTNMPALPGYRSPFERLAVAFAVLLTNKGAPLIYYGDEIGLPGAGDPDNRRMMQFTGLSADQQYLYNTIKALTAARAAHPALRRGHRTTISADADTWVFSMSAPAAGTVPADTVYVAINRGDGTVNVSGLPAGALNELVTGTTATGPSASLPPRQARIFVAK
jgi:glycosidase